MALNSGLILSFSQTLKSSLLLPPFPKSWEVSRKERYGKKPISVSSNSVISQKRNKHFFGPDLPFSSPHYLGCGRNRVSVRKPGVNLGKGQPESVSSHVSGGTAGEMIDMKVIRAAFLTCLLGVTNRVLYKMALVPLKEYPFFLAQLTTFGYVLVYFSILAIRYKAGIVTDEMLAVRKVRFAIMGGLEAMALASGMAAAAVLPGALLSILTQVYLLWQLAFSWLFLKKKYSAIQLLGCLLVALGVAIVVASGSGAGSEMGRVGLWPLLLILSTAFSAGASILKEFVFRDASENLKGGSIDLFVVNSYGSGFQALFVFLLLPILSKLKGIEFFQLPQYFNEGAGCLFNFGKIGTGCEGAPLLPSLYVLANLAFNISALHLLKTSSAVLASLTLTLAVPLTIAAFTLPLPLLGKPASLPPGFFLGSLVLIAGLALYNILGAQKKVPVKEE